jgi:uncharacterized Fe-S center protein
MSSKVYYVPFDQGAGDRTLSDAMRAAFLGSGLTRVVAEKQITGIKTHFGEEGNESYIPPLAVKAVVDEVRNAGGDPCLIETSTLYVGQRANAVDHFNLALEHGFGPNEMGCPLLFVDGLRGNLHVEQEVNLKHFKTVAVAGDFTFIPSVLVLTHVTGHLLGGLGGAIKNVGMGLASRAGKLRQHAAGRPGVLEDDCISCGTCAEWCPVDAISVPEKAVIDHEVCIGCGECVSVCPVDAIDFSWDAPAETFNERIAEYAYGILKGKDGRVGFLNVLHKVTRHCNCMGGEGDPICPDVGVLASTDPVAIDQATVDLAAQAQGADPFEETWPGKHYTAQLAHGEEIGLGSRDYELVSL